MPKPQNIFRAGIAAVLVVLIIMAIHWLGWLAPIESGIGYAFSPVVRGIKTVSGRLGNGLHLIGSISELDEENQRLQHDLESAQAEIATLQENQTELEDLRERLDAPLPVDYQTVVATIVGHDAITGTKTLTINRGSRSGIQEGMSVLSSSGILVGRVISALDGQSQVLLLSDDRSAVPSRIAQSRATGILRGELGLGMIMTEIPQQDTVNEGDQVVTSGLGGDMPDGIAIGSVEAVETADNALFQIARVRSFVDINRLETVHVLTEF